MASSVLKQSASKTSSLQAVSHPEVKSIVQHALDRVVKLLALCDQRIERLTISLSGENSEPEAQDKADKALLSLARMVLNLHKDLNRYTALVYPNLDRPEQSELIKQVPLGLETAAVSDLKLGTDKDSCDDDDDDVEAMTLDELKVLLEDTRDAANQFASAFNLPLMPTSKDNSQEASSQKGSTRPVGAYYVSDKKLTKQQRKEQKFSHSFFRKQNQDFNILKSV